MLDDASLEYLQEFGKNVVRDAGIELGAKQKKTSYRAKWSNGKLKSFTTVQKRYSSSTTGELKKSLSFEVMEVQGNYLLVFKAAEYWYYVNFGRKPGKYAPVGVIDEWIRKKPIRLQKGGGKGFAKQTPEAMKSLGFLINRKIKTFGIEGTRFFTKTFDLYSDKLRDDLGKRIANDLLKKIGKWPLQ